MAIPNGGARDIRTATKLKAEGVLPGAPDIFIPHAAQGWNGLFIEMKRVSGGKVSPQQKQVGDTLTENGYLVVVAYGVEEAYSTFKQYFSLS